MKLTILLGFVLMIDLFLLLWVAVGMVKDKRLFTTAPKDIQEVALEHDEDYPGQRYLGWFLLMLCAAVYAGTYIYGAYDGIRNGIRQLKAGDAVSLRHVPAADAGAAGRNVSDQTKKMTEEIRICSL